MGLRKFISKFFYNKYNDPNLFNGTGKLTYEEEFQQLGIFEYDEEGFIIRYEEICTRIRWKDITELNVYKRDLMTIDSITMDIVYGEMQTTISEDLPGWHQFVERSKIIFPEIPGDWDWVIVQPPFATNYRNIYKKEEKLNIK